MFLELKKEEIEKKYVERCEKYSIIMDDVNRRIEALDEKFGLILKYIYTVVTVADLAEVGFDVFVDYAVQAFILQQNFERVQTLPEELFLEYVVNPCAASEEIDVCRSAFYYLFLNYLESEDKFWNKENAKEFVDKKELLDGLTEEQIADEVNFWCAGEAAVKEAGERIVSAKTVFATGRGNGLELAVYYINALRSVGIPARIFSKEVVDSDGHIWVEVYVSNEWRKKPVCEPWYEVDANIVSDEASAKRMIARKARAQGNHFVKVKKWKNDEREKFFFGDIFTMNARAKLMKVMSEKDQLDMKYDVMEEHFNEGNVNESKIDEELFISYVLNPRIYQEVIHPWRKLIKVIFSEEDMLSFKENPLLIWKEIEKRFGNISEEELGREYTSPMGSVKLGKVSLVSKKLLFVAIARAVCIPARFCSENYSVEYWDGEKFVSAS